MGLDHRHEQPDRPHCGGVQVIIDPTQTVFNGSNVIASSHTGTDSITLKGVNSRLLA
jgi:hypothetical protein